MASTVVSWLFFVTLWGGHLVVPANANPVTLPSSENGEIPAQNLADLLSVLLVGKATAEKSYNDTCLKIFSNYYDECYELREMASRTTDYPSFPLSSSADTKAQLIRMFNVTVMYSHLIGQFANRIKTQTLLFGPHSTEHLDLVYLHTVLDSAAMFIHNLPMISGLVRPSPLPNLGDSDDPTYRNMLNVRVVARVALELDRMSTCLQRAINASNPASSRR